MDKLKDVASKMSGSGSNNNNNAKPQGSSGGQQDDYVDKAFAAGSKKAGVNLSRDQQEKITDSGRGLYEKQTGKKVSDKISN